MKFDETLNHITTKEYFSLKVLPNILWIADRGKSIYKAYSGELILDKIGKPDVEELCRFDEEYSVHRIDNGYDCIYLATLELKIPHTSITHQQYIRQIADKFAIFRESLAKILGGVKTRPLTVAELFERITGWPKETFRN